MSDETGGGHGDRVSYDDGSSALDEFAEDLEEIERRSPLARTLITVFATVAVVLVLLGVILAVSLMMRETETAVNELDTSDLPQVVLRSDDADITVVEGESDELVVTAEVTSGLFGTEYELRRRGTEIEIIASCFSVVNPGCGVEVEVQVPSGLPVEVATGSGNIVADGMRERILTLASLSGSISARDLAVDELDATTRSGDVTASFLEDPFAVKATTRSGDIDVVMPADAQPYRVDATSESGTVEQDMESSEAAPAFVRLLSQSGNVGLAAR